jgi:hypothetical protein
MKRLRALLILAAVCFCLPVSAWSTSVQNGVAVDAVKAALASDLGGR